MYAIRNRRTRLFVYGTDYRYHPPHQRTSNDKVLVYETEREAQFDFRHRGCGKDYEIVPVKMEVLED